MNAEPSHDLSHHSISTFSHGKDFSFPKRPLHQMKSFHELGMG